MYSTVFAYFMWLLTRQFFVYRVMAQESHRGERLTDRYSDITLHSTCNAQEVHDTPLVTRERRYETPRKFVATPFSGTLDPAEAEAWLKSPERIFNLMRCTPEERFD